MAVSILFLLLKILIQFKFQILFILNEIVIVGIQILWYIILGIDIVFEYHSVSLFNQLVIGFFIFWPRLIIFQKIFFIYLLPHLGFHLKLLFFITGLLFDQFHIFLLYKFILSLNQNILILIFCAFLIILLIFYLLVS